MKALVVGAGFAGLTAAVALSARYTVEVVEARDHLGGNAIDCTDPTTGVRYHPYGPHLFHTNSDSVFQFLSRYTPWVPYIHRVKSYVRGMYVDFPINLATLQHVLQVPGAQARAVVTELAHSTTATDTSMNGVMRRLIGDELFELFYKGYSEKQWGRSVMDLPAPIAKRIPIRFDYHDGYFNDKYQCLPMFGYAHLFQRMVSIHGLKVTLNTPLSSQEIQAALDHYDVVVYTGPIDALFDYCEGVLEYRSLRFEHIQRDSLPWVTVNYPSAEVPYTRETDFGLLPNAGVAGASYILREYPEAQGVPYYPVTTEANRFRYRQYQKHAKAFPNLLLVGRLAEYQYYNMDQVVASALAKVRAHEEMRTKLGVT